MDKFYRYRLTDEEWATFVKKHEKEWKETGEKIHAARTSMRLSMKVLAKEAGICAKTLSKLEQGCYISRFKTVSQSCRNALEKLLYKQINIFEKTVD